MLSRQRESRAIRLSLRSSHCDDGSGPEDALLSSSTPLAAAEEAVARVPSSATMLTPLGVSAPLCSAALVAPFGVSAPLGVSMPLGVTAPLGGTEPRGVVTPSRGVIGPRGVRISISPPLRSLSSSKVASRASTPGIPAVSRVCASSASGSIIPT
eukprot:4608386-Prymnesium_polylepis.2